MNIQGWFPLGSTCLISLQYKGLSIVFSSTIIQKHQLLGAQPSLWSNSHLYMTTGKTIAFSCGSVGKESTSNVGDLGSILGLGRSPGEGKGYPLQYSGLENSMDYTVYGVTKSWDMTEWLSLSLWLARLLLAKWCSCFLIHCLGLS